MSQVRRSSLSLAFGCALLGLLAFGCSKQNGAAFDPDAGHPSDFYSTHPNSYRSSDGACTDCHGGDLLGGISTVSCFSASRDGRTCHADGPGGHPPGWRAVHSVTDPATADTCATCHRSQPGTAGCFNNTLCHGAKSGHPSGWKSSHTSTDPSRASSCAPCHQSRSGTPGCFNNTLCHGAKSNHPSGWRTTHQSTTPSNAAPCAGCHPEKGKPTCFSASSCHGSGGGHPSGWSSGSQHGATAKAAPGSSSGFLYCESCHGSGLNGGSAHQSCLVNSGCHGWSAPHASSGWNGGGSRHRSTNQGNATVCAQCHQSSPGTPNCFNNTLCHGGD